MAEERGRWDDAIRDDQQGRDLFRTLHQVQPGDDKVTTQLVLSLIGLGNAFRHAQRHLEALEAIHEAPRSWKLSPSPQQWTSTTSRVYTSVS